MSWVQDIAGIIKRLLTIEGQVETNAEDIKALRHDLKALMGFTHKVAYAVKRNQERTEDKQENLILSLKLELAELEKRLMGSQYLNADRTIALEECQLPQRARSDSNISEL